MFFVQSKFALFWLLASLLSLAALSSAQTAKPRHRQKAKPKPKIEEQAQQAPVPPPPLTPEQLPSSAPTVTYHNGELTILAQNSTLSDILSAVHDQTGASIEIPPEANERVVSQFGPGPARDVLAKLLNGTHFNYVILGTAADPSTVAQLILTPRTGGSDTGVNGPVNEAGQPNGPAQPNGSVRPGFNQQVSQNQTQPPAEDTNAGMEEDASGDDADSDQSASEPGADQQQNPNQPPVKTPEQLLQELQRQQQVMQQQQQQPEQRQPQIVQPVRPYPQQPPAAQPPQP